MHSETFREKTFSIAPVEIYGEYMPWQIDITHNTCGFRLIIEHHYGNECQYLVSRVLMWLFNVLKTLMLHSTVLGSWENTTPASGKCNDTTSQVEIAKRELRMGWPSQLAWRHSSTVNKNISHTYCKLIPPLKLTLIKYSIKLCCSLGYILRMWAPSCTVSPHWCISSCWSSLTVFGVHWLAKKTLAF